MPTRRIRRTRGRQSVITPQILEMYRRLHDLPDNAPEHDRLAFGIRQHFGLKPWTPYEEFEALGDRLAAACGLKRRSDNPYALF
jgi:hypothetical protein